jgi:hypothetical protein
MPGVKSGELTLPAKQYLTSAERNPPFVQEDVFLERINNINLTTLPKRLYGLLLDSDIRYTQGYSISSRGKCALVNRLVK